MSDNDYTEIYNQIVHFVRCNGAKIRHKKLTHNFGLTDSDTGRITVDSGIRNTHKGCFVLLHEYIHFLQLKQPKYKSFFNIPPDVPKEKRGRWLDLIEKVETETDARAHKLLYKNWGLWHTPSDVANRREHLRKSWEKHFWGEHDGLTNAKRFQRKAQCKSPLQG